MSVQDKALFVTRRMPLAITGYDGVNAGFVKARKVDDAGPIAASGCSNGLRSTPLDASGSVFAMAASNSCAGFSDLFHGQDFRIADSEIGLTSGRNEEFRIADSKFQPG